MQEQANSMGEELREAAPGWKANAAGSGDDSAPALDDSLAMTPWERIMANDDMINFGDSLRAAMKKRNAKSR